MRKTWPMGSSGVNRIEATKDGRVRMYLSHSQSQFVATDGLTGFTLTLSRRQARTIANALLRSVNDTEFWRAGKKGD